jgi:cadmium resistance protein CadD (predicted permease)
VNGYLTAFSASVTTFTATNVDDAFLLTLLFARRIPARRIVAGQYVGFGAIVAVSLIAASAALAIPHRWVRFLGVLPLAIGIKQTLLTRRPNPEQPRASYGAASIALLTLSNGADNIGVYVPFFVIGRAYLWLILIVYAVLLALWCFGSRWLGNHSLILRSVDRWGRWAVPFVFIALGIYVLLR